MIDRRLFIGGLMSSSTLPFFPIKGTSCQYEEDMESGEEIKLRIKRDRDFNEFLTVGLAAKNGIGVDIFKVTAFAEYFGPKLAKRIMNMKEGEAFIISINPKIVEELGEI